ncbi:MAG: (Fe-S)-binding protein [Sphingobacteriales bacterium]|nr:(Fe-S)-binding protein [Sphingobacteriales bacterium]OJY91822.1 MAG: Fe-S oxidoreductase [Sphingobacteriales bacterium 44-15]
MKVEIFIPCFVDQLFPQTAFNMVRILEQAGCDVLYNVNQVCCGQPAFNAGFHKESRAVAEKFLETFSGEHLVVAAGGSCTGFVRNYYRQLFTGTELSEDVSIKAPLFYEFTEFLVEKLKILNTGSTFKGKAVYHDACGALRECGIKSAPRKLLHNIEGLQLIETEDCERCCGFGGTFSAKYEAISVAMGEQKVHNAIAAGADYIISTDLSCLMHLDGYIQQHRLPVKVLHIADVLVPG